jgi:type IV secretory pathway TraG/TraD family ATPase VirD4
MSFSDWPAPVKARGLVACAVAVVLWSVLARHLPAGTNLLTRETVPLFQFWTYLTTTARPSHRRSVAKIAAGVATALPILLFPVRVTRQGWPGTSPKALHGETRWASAASVKGGLCEVPRLYGPDKRGRYLRWGPEHVVATPRHARARASPVIPNGLLYEATLVCLDEEENWAATAATAPRRAKRSCC